MKSSTLRRSNITREKIAMLSALSDYNAAKGRSNAHITDKQAELDILWQNFKIAATSMYEATKIDTVALLRMNLVNKYSGQYYMNGVIKNVDNPNDSLVYVMPRQLTATKDGRTVRMFHYNNSTFASE